MGGFFIEFLKKLIHRPPMFEQIGYFSLNKFFRSKIIQLLLSHKSDGSLIGKIF